MERIRKSWEEHDKDIKILLKKLGSYTPEIIVPVMLGGLVPAALIAKQLKINDVRPIDIASC